MGSARAAGQHRRTGQARPPFLTPKAFASRHLTGSRALDPLTPLPARPTQQVDGPRTSEQATPNPFLHYRLEVTFTLQGTPPALPTWMRQQAANTTTVTVPGFFAADGNAGETSATAGSVWRAHFCPPHPGVWRYSIVFVARTGDSASHGYQVVRSGTCAGAGLRPIIHSSTCEAAATALKLSDTTADETDGTPRPEGCYWYNSNSLFLATNSANKGNGAETSDGSTTRHPICTTGDATAARADGTPIQGVDGATGEFEVARAARYRPLLHARVLRLAQSCPLH